jgi:hypothetical protein
MTTAHCRLHPTWIDYQLRNSERVGCLLAIVHEGELVLEYAAGSANIATGDPLPRVTASGSRPIRKASSPPASCSCGNGAR